MIPSAGFRSPLCRGRFVGYLHVRSLGDFHRVITDNFFVALRFIQSIFEAVDTWGIRFFFWEAIPQCCYSWGKWVLPGSLRVNFLFGLARDPVLCGIPDSKVHGANMGPILGRQDPGGPHVGSMILAIWDVLPQFKEPGSVPVICSICFV